ncbi:MAG: ATP-binding protein [Lachnospiraceae bacterium]|nr:ATP-binding protein [Lachnospiraceae bacterium]
MKGRLSRPSDITFRNPYYRGTNTKERPEGSGLGLAIAKQIIVLHGGEITVRSKLGEGTEFTIFLPLANDPDAS